MDNFISLLDHTLHMNNKKEDEKSESDNEDEVDTGIPEEIDDEPEEEEDMEPEQVEEEEEEEEEKNPGVGVTYNVKKPKVRGPRHSPVVDVPELDVNSPPRRPPPEAARIGPGE